MSMKTNMIIKAGSTDIITYFEMRLAANGLAATGLTPANFDLQYTRSGSTAVAKVDATLNANGIGGAHSDNTVIEVDAASSPGLYRIDWPDAAFAVSTREVILSVIVATAFSEKLRIELTPIASDLVEIDGNATNSNLATLNLKQLVINNGAGVGVDIDGSTNGLDIDGNITGILVNGGNGYGVQILSQDFIGANIRGDTGGLLIESIDSGPGIDINAVGIGINIDATGDGIDITSGAKGIFIDSTTIGIDIDAGTVGIDIDAVASNGIEIASGTSGIYINADQIGINIDALVIGVDIDGGVFGMTVNANNGDAVAFTSTGGGGDGLVLTGNGAGLDINAAEINFLIDPRSEPGQALPPVSTTTNEKIDYLYKNWRNKKEQTGTLFKLYDDAEVTVDQKATISDAGGTFTKDEVESGP